MSVDENKAVYVRFVEEVINGGNLGVIEEIFSPDYVDHSLPPGAPPGLAAVRMVPSLFRGGFPDVHFTIEQMVGEGDWVATRVTGHGTHQGAFMGIPATGNTATWSSVGFFRVENGKIVEHHGVPDLMGLMRQLGAGPGGPDAPGHGE